MDSDADNDPRRAIRIRGDGKVCDFATFAQHTLAYYRGMGMLHLWSAPSIEEYALKEFNKLPLARSGAGAAHADLRHGSQESPVNAKTLPAPSSLARPSGGAYSQRHAAQSGHTSPQTLSPPQPQQVRHNKRSLRRLPHPY